MCIFIIHSQQQINKSVLETNDLQKKKKNKIKNINNCNNRLNEYICNQEVLSICYINDINRTIYKQTSKI